MATESSDVLPGLYAAFASVVLFVIITAVFLGAMTAASVGLAAGALSSAAVGFFTVRRGLARPVAGAMQFARPWLWFTAWAAVALYDGRYQPMVAAGTLALGMTVSFWLGGGVAHLRRRR